MSTVGHTSIMAPKSIRCEHEPLTADQATERIARLVPDLLYGAHIAPTAGHLEIIDRQCQLLINLLEDVQIRARQRMREL